MHNAILIDTPLWLAYFREGAGHWAETVAETLAQESAVTCGSVVAALLAEASTVEDAKRIGEALQGLPHLPMTDEVCRYAGELSVMLRETGIVLRLPTLLTASAATLHHTALLTSESRLHAASQLRPLKLLCV